MVNLNEVSPEWKGYCDALYKQTNAHRERTLQFAKSYEPQYSSSGLQVASTKASINGKPSSLYIEVPDHKPLLRVTAAYDSKAASMLVNASASASSSSSSARLKTLAAQETSLNAMRMMRSYQQMIASRQTHKAARDPFSGGIGGTPSTANPFYSAFPNYGLPGGHSVNHQFLDVMVPMFGPPGQSHVFNPTLGKDTVVPNMSDAFPEAELLGRITLLDGVTSSKLEIFKLFEFKYSENIAFELDQLVFSSHIADRLTYRVSPRLVSYRQARKQFRLVMEGMGQAMEAYLFGDKKGQFIWQCGGVQIQRAIVENFALGCYLELLWAPYSARFTASRRPRHVSADTVLVADIQMFDAFTKLGKPLPTIVQFLLTEIAGKYKAVNGADTFLVCPQKARDRYTASKQANPPNSGQTYPSPATPNEWGVAGIIESRTFSSIEGDFDPFDAYVYIGRFITIPATTLDIKAEGKANTNFKSSHLTRKTVCLRSNGLIEFTANLAFERSGLFTSQRGAAGRIDSAKGKLGKLVFAKEAAHGGASDLARWWTGNDAMKHAEELSTQVIAGEDLPLCETFGEFYTDEHLNIMAICLSSKLQEMKTIKGVPSWSIEYTDDGNTGHARFDTSGANFVTTTKTSLKGLRIDRASFSALISQDVPTFFTFHIIAPRICWSSSACALAARGSCAAFVGKSMVTMLPPGESKLYQRDMSIHGRGVVIQPEAVAVSSMLMINDYVSGDNGEIYTPAEEPETSEHAADHYGHPDLPSYLVIVQPPGERELNRSWFDVGGYPSDSLEPRTDRTPPAYILAAYYRKMYNFQNGTRDMTYSVISNVLDMKIGEDTPNTIVCQGPEWSFDATGRDFQLRQNTGHEGPMLRPGFRSRRKELPQASPTLEVEARLV